MPGPTPDCSSPGPTARPGTQASSPAGSPSSSPTLGYHRYGCMTSGAGAATIAHAAGADLKDIQHLLGHSGIAITADTYTTLLPQRARATAEAIAAAIPRMNPLPRRHGHDQPQTG